MKITRKFYKAEYWGNKKWRAGWSYFATDNRYTGVGSTATEAIRDLRSQRAIWSGIQVHNVTSVKVFGSGN